MNISLSLSIYIYIYRYVYVNHIMLILYSLYFICFYVVTCRLPLLAVSRHIA